MIQGNSRLAEQFNPMRNEQCFAPVAPLAVSCVILLGDFPAGFLHKCNTELDVTTKIYRHAKELN